MTDYQQNGKDDPRPVGEDAAKEGGQGSHWGILFPDLEHDPQPLWSLIQGVAEDPAASEPFDMPAGPVVFAADLIPGKAWVHLPITMGYDRYPELLIDEKATLLGDLLHRHGRLFFTHDPSIAMSTLARDEKGRYHTINDVPEIRSLAP